MTVQKQPSYEPFFEQLLTLARLYSPSAVPVPEGSRQYWVNVISGFTPKAINHVLNEWASENNRMILPADLAKKLAAYRSDKIEAKAKEIAKADNAPLPQNIDELCQTLRAQISHQTLNIPDLPTLWARRLQIKEAYGFSILPCSATTWRRVLGYEDTYNFEDMPELPCRTGKVYVPNDQIQDAEDPGRKFIFFYEHEYKPGQLVTDAEWIFDLMNSVQGDYRLYYFDQLEQKVA